MSVRRMGLGAVVLALVVPLAWAQAAAGPVVRGPSKVRPKTKVVFEVSGFPSNADLGVVLWPTRERNDPPDHACLKAIEKEFESDDTGDARISFRFPRYCRFPSGATGRWVSVFWKGGQRVDVRVFVKDDEVVDPDEIEYAIKVVKVIKSRAPKRLTIPTTRRQAIFRAVCKSSSRCRAKVNIAAGKKTLARGRYAVPPHKSRKVRIALTKAGRRTMARRRYAAAKLTIVDTRTHKRETIPVVLKRR